MDVCPELVVKVPASTSKVAVIVEEVNRTLWGEVHRRTREASRGVGGLIPPPLQTRRTPCWEELGKISSSPRASVISIPSSYLCTLLCDSLRA